jgi:hypothetical protein
MCDVIIINVNEKINDHQNQNFTTIENFDFGKILQSNDMKYKSPDIFVVCTQYTYTLKTNFQKLFETLAKQNGYELLKESKIGGITSKYSIQTKIYIKNTIDKNNIKNIKFDLLDLGLNFGCIYLYFEYNFYKINVFNSDSYDKIHNSTIFSKSSKNIFKKQEVDISIFKESKIKTKTNTNTNTNTNTSNIILFDTNYKESTYKYFPQKHTSYVVNLEPKVINGFYYILDHKDIKIDSLTIININEEGNCFDDNNFKDFYNKNISFINTDLIIVCSQNSISRKIGCKHFQTLLRESIENNGKGKYQLKNKKNSSELVNISRHISIGELSSLGIRTRVYFKKDFVDDSRLIITFKSINFTGPYGSILCSIEYYGKKIHVINSCFFDKETLGIFKKSYKNEKIDEYMKIIKEFELVKKINDDLFFVGHNIKFNLSCGFKSSSNKKKINIICNNELNDKFNEEIKKYKKTLKKNDENKIKKIKLLFTKYNNYIEGTRYNNKINFKEINGINNKKIPLEFLKLSYKTKTSEYNTDILNTKKTSEYNTDILNTTKTTTIIS